MPYKDIAKKKAYYAANRDKQKAHDAANRDKKKAYDAAYRAANRDKGKAYRAAYNATNQDKINKKNRARYSLRSADNFNSSLTLLATALKETK